MLKEEIVEVDDVPIRAKLLTHSRRMREAVRVADNKQLRVSLEPLSSSMSLLTKAKVAQVLARRSGVRASDHRPRHSAGMQHALLRQRQGLRYQLETAGTGLQARSSAHAAGQQATTREGVTYGSIQGHGHGQGGPTSVQQQRRQEQQDDVRQQRRHQDGQAENQAQEKKCRTEADRDAKAKALAAAEEEKAVASSVVRVAVVPRAQEKAKKDKKARVLKEMERLTQSKLSGIPLQSIQNHAILTLNQ